jgi:hypothetical protein
MSQLKVKNGNFLEVCGSLWQVWYFTAFYCSTRDQYK